MKKKQEGNIMRVMSCNRKGCHNILCNRYSYEYGNICEECFEELVDSTLNIEEFMNQCKTQHSTHYYEKQNKEKQLNKIFSNVYPKILGEIK